MRSFNILGPFRTGNGNIPDVLNMNSDEIASQMEHWAISLLGQVSGAIGKEVVQTKSGVIPKIKILKMKIRKVDSRGD